MFAEQEAAMSIEDALERLGGLRGSDRKQAFDALKRYLSAPDQLIPSMEAQGLNPSLLTCLRSAGFQRRLDGSWKLAEDSKDAAEEGLILIDAILESMENVDEQPASPEGGAASSPAAAPAAGSAAPAAGGDADEALAGQLEKEDSYKHFSVFSCFYVINNLKFYTS